MERMAGKIAGDRRFEVMGGVVDQSIASQHSVCHSMRIQVSLLRRHVALFLG